MTDQLEATASQSQLAETTAVYGRMTRPRFLGFIITIFATAYILFAVMITIPVISNFYVLFGDQPLMVNYIVSGGLLIAILANLVGARLMRVVSKRTLMIIGLALFTVAGTFQVAVLDVWYIAIVGTIASVGCGLVVIAATSLLSEAYPDEKKRGTMLGWYNAFGSIVGAVLSTVAGLVATQVASWTSVYWLFAVAGIVLILAVFFIPATPTDQELEAHDAAGTVKDRIPTLPMAGLGIAGFVLSLVYTVPVYLISVLVLERALGDEATAGMLSSATTVGSAIGCAVFGILFRYLGRLVATLSYALMAVGVVLLLADGVGVVAAGCVVMGIAYGAGFVYYTARATTIVPPSRVPVALSIAWATINLGGFASTYGVTALQNALGITTVSGVFPFLLGLLIVGTVLSVVFAVIARMRATATPIAVTVTPA